MSDNESIYPSDMEACLQDILRLYSQTGLRIATAESCTAGLLAGALTECGGASSVFERGFVTYSNESKTELLGVSAQLIAQVGAVSKEVAKEMAYGALQHSKADLALSITGIAGPSGGTAEKPVGLVFFGLAHKNGGLVYEEQRFSPALSRHSIRMGAVRKALEILRYAIDHNR